MIKKIKKYFKYNFKKKLIKNYFFLKKKKKYDLLPKFEKDFIDINTNCDFRYLNNYQRYYNIDFHHSLKQLLYEKIFHRLRTYYLYTYNKKNIIFFFPLPKIYKNFIKDKFNVFFSINQILWFLLSILFVFRSSLKFLKYVSNCILINKNYTHQNNSIFFCNINEKFIPISDNDQSLINWYVKKKNDNNLKYYTVSKKPINSKCSINLEYEKKIIPQITNYLELIKLIIIVSKYIFFSFFQLIFFNRWQYAFLIDEVINLYIFDLIDKKKISKEYIFINAEYVYRPLWTYIAEKKAKSKIKLIFYSTGILQSFQLDFIENCSWSLVNWPFYHFWDNVQLDLIKKASNKDFTYEIENYIPAFHKYSNFEIPHSDICIFDDPPYDPYNLSLFGLIDEIYDCKNCIAFIDDISEVLLKSNLIVLFKIKKYKSTLDKKYIHKIKELKHKNIKMIDADISPQKLIEKTKLTISFPFSTPSVISKNLNKKSIFYHPNTIRQSIYLNRDIPVINGKKNLQKELTLLFT